MAALSVTHYADLPYPENKPVALAHSLVARGVIDKDGLKARLTSIRTRLKLKDTPSSPTVVHYFYAKADAARTARSGRTYCGRAGRLLYQDTDRHPHIRNGVVRSQAKRAWLGGAPRRSGIR